MFNAKTDLVVGHRYIIKTSLGHVTEAEFIHKGVIPGWESKNGSFKTHARSRYHFKNLRTGRQITLKSTAKVYSYLGDAQ